MSRWQLGLLPVMMMRSIPPSVSSLGSKVAFLPARLPADPQSGVSVMVLGPKTSSSQSSAITIFICVSIYKFLHGPADHNQVFNVTCQVQET